MPTVQLKFENGSTAWLEIAGAGEQDVAEHQGFGLENVFAAVEGLAAMASKAFEKIHPKTSKLEIGLTTKIEAGQLVAVFVKGSADANIKVTLEW